MNIADLAAALRRLLGAEQVIDDPARLAPYRHDWIPGDYRLPDLVVIPTDPARIPLIVQLARQAGIPIVARGAGTGLAGGARPLHGGVVIDMTRLDAIEQIDLPNRQALVQAGMVTYQLSAALAEHGWFYAPDPASWRMCTIGGNIANNSGGPRCLKYGVTANHVAAVEVTLADGRQTWLGDGTTTFAWHGYDLIGLLVGSEGTFGIVSRAIVRLTRAAEAHRVAMALFPDPVAACAAVSAILAAGYLPAALEVMDATTMLAVNRAQGADLPAEAGAALIIEIDGVREGLDETMAEICALCQAHGAFQLRTAATPAEQERLWSARRSAFASFHTIAPSFYLVDTVVPRTRLPAMMAHVQRLSAAYQMPVANVFHAGDGNLHPLVLYDPSDPDQVAKAHALTAEVLDLSIAEGGAVSGEHGIGIEKRDFLARLFGRDELAAQALVYAVFNPDCILNPGKVFPVAIDPLALAAERAAQLQAPASSAPWDDLVRQLVAIVGADFVLTGAAAGSYAVQDQAPRCVVLPGDTEALAAVMAACYQARVHVVPWGGGTQQAIGPLVEQPEVVVVTRRLNRVLKYEPDDLTIGVEAGMTVAELQTLLAAHGQCFPLEAAASERATVGGVVATAASGPRSLGYGTLRDLVLGLTVVQVDGTIIRLGGQVVKNVSGYDLVKLFTGSYGTLGVITEVRMRTFPQPPATVTLAAGFADQAAMAAALTAIAATQLCPAAVEVYDAAMQIEPRLAGAMVVVVRYEGHPAACARAVAELRALALAHGATAVYAESGSQQEQYWRPALQLAALPHDHSAWPIRMAVLPEQFATAFADLQQCAARYRITATLGGRPYHGLVYGHLSGDPAQIGLMLAEVAGRWPHTQILSGFLPPEQEPLRWGQASTPIIAELSARLKRAFDPYDRLNRRRWPYNVDDEPPIMSASVAQRNEGIQPFAEPYCRLAPNT